MQTEIERLEQVIAVIEAQRPTLGTLTDEALSPLQARRNELQAITTAQSAAQREITMLYCETNNLQPLRDAVQAENGNILNPEPQLFIGMFTQEDNARQAATAALTAQQSAPFKIGIASGFIATGQLRMDTPLLMTANQLHLIAAPGMTVIEQNAYRHLRGLFNIEGAGDRQILQKTTPIYLVTGVKDQPFRSMTRSIEGIETRTIGRDTELASMKQIFEQTIRDKQATVVSLVGPGGIGKSRLRQEFENYVELLPEPIFGFQGRGMEQHQHTPFSVLRNILFNRFSIYLNDAPHVARDKLTQGLANFVDTDADEYAAIIGYVIGLDFSDSPYLSGLLSQQATAANQINNRARHYIVQILRRMVDKTGYPIIIYLEDLHWSDDESLGMIEHIVRNTDDLPLFMLSMARPALLERRPDWLADHDNLIRIDLEPLSRETMRELVDEIMQLVERLPDILREMLAGGADGNPYYLETLVSLLIDKDVIVKGRDSWRVAPDKLITATLPLALEDVINARLDDITPEQLTALYQAATVGRAFWTQSLKHISQEDDDAIDTLIADWHKRDFVYALNDSTLLGMQEIFFKHNVLHNTVYDAIPATSRVTYHQQAAQWLVNAVSARQAEWVTIIAMHYLRGKDYQHAAEYALKAADFSINRRASKQAIEICQSIIQALPDEGYTRILARLQEALGRAYRLGRLSNNHQLAVDAYQAGLQLLETTSDAETQVNILNGMALCYRALDQILQAREAYDQAVDIAHKLNDRTILATIAHTGGVIALAEGNFEEAVESYRTSLAHYEKLGEPSGLIQTLLNAGYALLLSDAPTQAIPLYNRALKLAEEVRDYWSISVALLNLGEIARVSGDLDQARIHFERSLSISERVGNEGNIAVNILNLGMLALSTRAYPDARRYLLQALAMTTRLNRIEDTLYTLTAIARLWSETDDPNSAMTLLGLVANHPRIDHETRQETDNVTKKLEEQVGTRMVQIGIQSGRALDLNTIVKQILTRHQAT
jgi:predicted ATPase